ncbi:aldo/keto reductase [Listeria innocua]|uniref:aldo/keto reductase n=1 Tax=Listeria innocua TaxID=1642 RepID=UPI0016236B4D|nr:aldo/keto reductase [Listeria innocua]EBF5116993.1 aldo/keto reductase [Listeria monocytogenes]EBF5125818.1 aldo/keto reductase [Listeria monocytogenes]EBF5152146.1 aldo/keto reductase [Listeria monocytogenes]EBF5204683.1 aldo/keto reductase [Listeria monocytogenes]MBC1904782.1 aldo/keto reductase [Listeria innocua]
MKLRRLGQSNLWLSPLGLGTWQFSHRNGLGGKFWKEVNQEQVTQIIKTSLQGGMNWIDTAEAYGHGTSEQMIAKSLEEIDCIHGEVNYATPYLADKWWPLGRRATSLSETISIRRSNLGGRKIDLYQIHHPTSISSLEKQMNEMIKLVDDQHIRYVGVSNFSAIQLRKAHNILQKAGVSLISNQVRYNLFDRRIEKNGVLDTAKELGIAIIAYSPLHQGLLTGKFHHEPEQLRNLYWLKKIQYNLTKKQLKRTFPLIKELENMAETHHVSAAQIALAWLICANKEVVFAIPGASSLTQIEGNIKAMQVELSSKEIQKLSDIL